jgi:hypothetical protein
MAHIVTLKTAPGDTALVYLCTPPDMASTMGGFGPARYVGNTPPIPGASYVITTDDLPRFQVYCTNRGVHVMDSRGGGKPEKPYGRNAPLPECTHCGQPARRGARLEHCPNCGSPWDPIELGAPYIRQQWAVVVCDECSSETPSGFSHCIRCGAAHA